MSSSFQLSPGSVALVGGGPGAADLITLRAFHCLQQADVVLHDLLVGPDVLAHIPEGVARINVGKAAGRHSWAQADICALLVEKARAGLRVVRLKGGDPFIFGRGGEEMDALMAAGIAVQVIPGITAAMGAAASLAFPLTHRDHAHSCVFVTGHLQHDQLSLNWTALAQPRQTVVIYMGLTGVKTIAAELQAAGLAAQTPVAIVRSATCPDQATFVTTLEGLPETVRLQQVQPPALLIIGSVVGLMDVAATQRTRSP
ncbi:uroporphyrinogen-III C-methyltransferase [Roseateles amylovorans]|uniref:uroporphyrinogen-III C-methyltransferase n=1 Tax=Roseateles amylovorans TaxID=2978473 RepID=A0ABY6B1K1_9BURK|nr:uroporphyrinogen-III C-methyltransferase [Roseateles amylovorans]UXH79093.1 uroporphyrinogen-III C-methyltransferase [Roseateles amylovorans]